MSYYHHSTTQPSKFRPDKAEHWEPYREHIAALYAENTLTEVIEQMKAMHNFSATPKQYKTKFKEWGLANKYITAEEYEELLAQGEQAERRVRGKQVSRQDIARFLKRKQKIEAKEAKKRGSSGTGTGSGTGRAGTSAGSHGSAGNIQSATGQGYYDDNGGEGPSGTAHGSASAAAAATAVAAAAAASAAASSGSYTMAALPQGYVGYPVSGPGSGYDFAATAYGYGQVTAGYGYQDQDQQHHHQQPQQPPQHQASSGPDTSDSYQQQGGGAYGGQAQGNSWS